MNRVDSADNGSPFDRSNTIKKEEGDLKKSSKTFKRTSTQVEEDLKIEHPEPKGSRFTFSKEGNNGGLRGIEKKRTHVSDTPAPTKQN